jgi:transposase-like protein
MTFLTLDRFKAAVARFIQVEAVAMSNWEAICNCPSPGEQEKCWDCPYYKKLGQLTQQRLHDSPEKVFAKITPLSFDDPYSEASKKVCQEMYQAGYSIDDIQQLVVIPLRRKLRDWLRECGLPERALHYPEQLKQKCLEMYSDRCTVRQIENETGVPADTITDWAYEEKISRKRKYPTEIRQQCLELYKTGHSSEAIHAMTGVHVITLRAWIADAEIGRVQKRYSEDEKLHCLRLYQRGELPREIEATTGVKQVTIRSWIRKERWSREQASDVEGNEEPKENTEKLDQPPTPRKPLNYWKNFETVQCEILALNKNREQVGVMPTARELHELGRGDLQKAISKHHHGFQTVAEKMGLAYRQKRSRYWYDFETVKRELFAFIKEHGVPGVMPTKTELEAVKMGSLCMAIDLHGGFPVVANMLNLELSYGRKHRGYWKNPDNLRAEIERVAEQLGNPGVLPTHEELKQIGRTDLNSAISDNGGWTSVARKLGFSYSRQYNNPNDYFSREKEEEQK